MTTVPLYCQLNECPQERVVEIRTQPNMSALEKIQIPDHIDNGEELIFAQGEFMRSEKLPAGTTIEWRNP